MRNTKLSFATRLLEPFAINAQSARLFRVCLALLGSIDLIDRARDSDAFLNPAALLSAQAVEKLPLTGWQTWSFHPWLQAQGMLEAFTVIHILCLLGSVGGRLQRPAALGAWMCFLSLHNANPFVQYGADTLFRMMLFWSVFLPSYREEKGDIVTWSTVGLALQTLAVYVVAVLVRTYPHWHADGTALYYIFSIDQQVSPAGRALQAYPEFLRHLTPVVLYGELLLPLLAFVPVVYRFTRPVCIATLAVLHVFISITMNLHWFAAVSICSWIPFVRVKAPQSLRIELLRPGWHWAAFPFLLIVVGFNVCQVLTAPNRAAVAAPLRPIVYGPRLDQEWKLYAPYPYTGDGWFYVVAETSDGARFEVEGLPGLAGITKPRLLSARFPSNRWRKFIYNIWMYRKTGISEAYGNWLCRQIQHEGLSAASLDVYFMLEETQPPGTPVTVRQIPFVKQSC